MLDTAKPFKMNHGEHSQPHKQLLVLGCSATKVQTNSSLPAIHLYDGPAFRVLRSFLREHRWPDPLSVAVLSAKYGMIGGLSHITAYDQRMTIQRAKELSEKVNRTLQQWGTSHSRIDLVLGQDYLHSIDTEIFHGPKPKVQIVDGPIGIKLNRLHQLLRSFQSEPRFRSRSLRSLRRPLYFLPDWDDFLDVDYNFIHDRFSNRDRSQRHEEHSIALMRPQKLCDGVLVSLAQNLGSKGLLKRIAFSDEEGLAPKSVREHFSLRVDQWAFGDCGAFSYVAEAAPTISVDQAVSLYDLYDFDLGASVDHIPVPETISPNGKRTLSRHERRARVKLTKENAARFMEKYRERGARFIPVGVIQGLGPRSYANQVGEYIEMGYEHLAIGGLVPRSDAEILEIVRGVSQQVQKLRSKPWIHLLGIFRPSLQAHFRELEIGSFDSATYFRKAWLRSDQNYLGADGSWYAAIRVPPLNDPRTKMRLEKSGVKEPELKKLEKQAMTSLRAYDNGTVSVDKVLDTVVEYDRLLQRAELIDKELLSAYRRTLAAKPWRQCPCPMCKSLGIEILIFRGLNRNKRRGAHNTLQLFRTLQVRNSKDLDADVP